jgi:hypothetical protein
MSGSGQHGWRGNVSYVVKRNEAQQHVIVEVTIPARPAPFIVRFHTKLLGGRSSDSPVSPPADFERGNWLVLNPKSDQMQNLGTQLSNPPPLDAMMGLTLKLGNASFGLIHMIAGHHDDLRTLTGAGVAQVGGSTPEQQAEMQQYRSYLAIQAGLQQCLGISSLQAIYQDATDPSKWIFVGLWGDKSVIVVALRSQGRMA